MSGIVSVRSRYQRRLVAACTAGLLAMGSASNAWSGTVPAGVTGGQGGIGNNVSAIGGAAGNGGQAKVSVPGGVGSGGKGGDGGTANGSGSLIFGGFGGGVGSSYLTSSTITGSTGGGGGTGNSSPYLASGSGGGGGGDGVYGAAGITLTVSSTATVQGGAGGTGGPPGGYAGGSGGGGGNGVEFAGTGGTLINYGKVYGGTGGVGGGGPVSGQGPSGAGGGHGVVGAGITITNSGTVTGGVASVGQNPDQTSGTNGDAILFKGGNNALNLQTGSTITGNIELATGASAVITPQASGVTFSNAVVLDADDSLLVFDSSAAPLTVSSAISGPGSSTLTLTGTIAGVTSISAGTTQVDGSIGNATIGDEVLSGVGSVGYITTLTGSTVAPGEPATMFGALNSGGANFASGSTLRIRSTDGNTCSALNASGALTLDGTLSLRFENAPRIGAICTIATGSSVSGTFANVESEPAQVTVMYNATNVQFTVTGSDSVFADGFEGGAL